MGVAELLTIIFVILKLTDTVTWSWWTVLLPELIAVGIYLLLFIVWLVLFIIAVIKVRV